MGEPKFSHLSFPFGQFPPAVARFASVKLPDLGLSFPILWNLAKEAE
jgi:hypothetical protein